MKKYMIAASLLLAQLVLSCGGGGKKADVAYDTVYIPRYAEGFSILSHGGNRVVRMTNPWQGADGIEYELYLRKGEKIPPKGFRGTVVDYPLRRIVCMSASYIGFLDAVGKTEVIKGVSGARYIHNEKVRQGLSAGDIRDVGFDTNMNFELLASIQPDIVLIYGVGGDNTSLTLKLDELGIPYFYIGDYLESEPLGKAEWVRVFGEMTGAEDTADSVFSTVETSYNELKSDISTSISDLRLKQPVILLNSPWRDTWYVPGDRNYMVRFIADAGGIYSCSGIDSDQSRPISLEGAYTAGMISDVWLNPGQLTIKEELISENPRLKDIPPVLSGRIYNNNLRLTPEGGSDFWESGAVRPDLVLRDLAAIFYPAVYNYPLYYYRHLN